MNKFAQSLADYTPRKKDYFDVNPNEKVRNILKTAATTSLVKSDSNSIKKFVEQRITSDFSMSKGNIRVSIKPTKVDREQNLIDGEGKAIIRVGNEDVIVPFKIIGGEVSDFSKIIVSGKTYPYNKNILNRIESGVKKKAQEDEPFIGTSKQYNSDTDRGFLEDAVQIRDEFMRKNNYGGFNQGTRFVYASTSDVLENMLEKIASIEAMPKKVIDRIERDVMLKVAKTYSHQIEKQALEIDPEISHMKDIFKKIDELPLKSIKQMKHGQKILFPEKVGNEISMVQGVVFKDLESLDNVDKKEQSNNNPKHESVNLKKPISMGADGEFNKFSDYKYLVISADRRIALINDSDDFLALEDNNAHFKLSSKTLNAVKEDEIYVPIIKNTVFMPQQMKRDRSSSFYGQDFYMSTYNGGIYGDREPYAAKGIVTNNKFCQLVGSSYPFREIREFPTNNRRDFSRGRSADLILVPKAKFETGKTADTRIRHLFGEDVNGYMQLSSALPYIYYLIDGDTKVFTIKGFITGYTKKKGELKPGGADPILKLASDNLIITELKNNKGFYAAKTIGSKPKMLGKNLKKQDVTRIMKMLGYSKVDTARYLAELETKGKCTAELPLNANINSLYNGKVESKTKSIMKQIVGKNFDKKKVKKAVRREMQDLSANVLGSIAADSDTGYYLLSQIAKLGEEAEGCSLLFEKTAVEHRNHDLQHIAMACTVTKNLCDFIKEAYDSDDCYRGVVEACDYIEKNAGTLEDVVTNISNLYDAQFEHGNEIIPYSAMKVAMEVIGDAVYMAQGITKVAQDAPQDLICKECGAKVDKPLKDGKCDECIKAEIEDKNEGDTSSYTNPAEDAINKGRTRGQEDYNSIV